MYSLSIISVRLRGRVVVATIGMATEMATQRHASVGPIEPYELLWLLLEWLLEGMHL